MTRDELLQILPGAGARVDVFLGPLDAAMAEFGIDTPARQAAFLAQIGHESRQLQALEESLNYRPEAILSTFNSRTRQRFTPAQAQQFGRTAAHPADQEMIANIAYAGRGGNGDVASGDGWRYRGAGLIQLTLRETHEACARHFGLPPDQVGAWLRTPEGACRSAGWFWRENDLSDLADAGSFEAITRKINAALDGESDRVALWNVARNVLGVA